MRRCCLALGLGCLPLVPQPQRGGLGRCQAFTSACCQHHLAQCSSGLSLRGSLAPGPVLCPAETERAQWILSDSPKKAGLGHQPPGGEQLLPCVDDGCQPATRHSSLHTHLHGDPNHYVSGPSQGGCCANRSYPMHGGARAVARLRGTAALGEGAQDARLAAGVHCVGSRKSH